MAERMVARPEGVDVGTFFRRYTQLFAFAYFVDGLNLSREGARQWADRSVAQIGNSDPAMVEELFEFAYRPDGLNLGREGARKWLDGWLVRLGGVDVGTFFRRFKQLFDYAHSVDGLNQSRDGARRWANARSAG